MGRVWKHKVEFGGARRVHRNALSFLYVTLCVLCVCVCVCVCVCFVSVSVIEHRFMSRVQTSVTTDSQK